VDPDGREILTFLDPQKNKIIVQAAEKYPDDAAIHIFAHGSPKGMSVFADGKTISIRNVKQLDKLLSKYSETWKNKGEKDNITIVLHSGRTGEGENSFAQKVSEGLEGVTVIAPDQRGYFSSKGEFGAYKAKYVDDNNEYERNNDGQIKSKERSNELGNWRVFRDGKETESYKGDWKPKENPSWWDKFLNKN